MDQVSPSSTVPSASSVTPTKEQCCGSGMCGQCMKGGMPFPKEVTTFLFLIFLGTSLILGVLLIVSKREVLSLQRQPAGNPETPAVQQYAFATAKPKARTYEKPVVLPKPKLTGSMAVEEAMQSRRTRRTFDTKPVTLSELSQMLWAGQGITDAAGKKRTVPSARETYPLTIFVVVRNVTGLEPGLYEYLPKEHALGIMLDQDVSEKIKAAGIQETAQKSPVLFMISAAYGKSVEMMKAGAQSSGLLEAGHLGQNLYLQAESLEMATVAMAGFDAKKVGESVALDSAETIVYLFPFGHRGEEVAPQE